MDKNELLEYLPFPELPIDRGSDDPRDVDAALWVRKTEVIRSLSTRFPHLGPVEIRWLVQIASTFQQINAADEPEELPSVGAVLEARNDLTSLAMNTFGGGDLNGDPLGKLLQKTGVLWAELDRIEFSSLTEDKQSFFLEHLAEDTFVLSDQLKTGYELGEIPEFRQSEVKEHLEHAREQMKEGDFSLDFFDAFTPIPPELLEAFSSKQFEA